jgi:hypothetical protein
MSMADFTIRSDNVDVEQIMRQIRTRIREKRGVDYTEDEVRELAGVKLEKFLNPRAVRSDLVEHYRRRRPLAPLAPDNYAFEADTIYESHRRPLQFIRRLLNPILKLFFNPNPVVHVLHRQGKINAHVLHALGIRDELDALNFEVLNNIVLELTRTTIEVNNLRMRLESMNARQEFNERRARAFEGLVAGGGPGAASAAPGAGSQEQGPPEAEDAEARARRRRRRRGRRRPDGEPGDRQRQSAAGPAPAPPSTPTAETSSSPKPQPAPPPEVPPRSDTDQ